MGRKSLPLILFDKSAFWVLLAYFIDGEGADRYGQQQAYCYVSGNDARNAQPSAPRATGERAGCGQGK